MPSSFGLGAEGEAHELRDVDYGETIRGVLLFNLMLAAVEIRLTEGTGDRDGIYTCFLRFVEEVVCKS